MPAKNKIKVFAENSFYHAYNRGYNRQEIFRDDHDYKTFLHLFRKYLEPGFKEKKTTPSGQEYLVETNHVYQEVDLVCYCLMPNHFHLLLFQKSLEGMTKLLVRLMTNYSTFFNQRYGTQSSPFQGTYKAVSIGSEAQMLQVSRYIHANLWELPLPTDVISYPYSSYPHFVSVKSPDWLKTNFISDSFSSKAGYRGFVDDYVKMKIQSREKELEGIKHLLLDHK